MQLDLVKWRANEYRLRQVCVCVCVGVSLLSAASYPTYRTEIALLFSPSFYNYEHDTTKHFSIFK